MPGGLRPGQRRHDPALRPGARTVVLTPQFRDPVLSNGHDGLLIEAAARRLDDAGSEERIRAEAEERIRAEAEERIRAEAEEVGYRVRDVRKVFEAFMCTGSFTEKLHFFVGAHTPADLVRPGGGIAAECEDIEVIELPIDFARRRTTRPC